MCVCVFLYVICMFAQSLSFVWLSAAPGTIACQNPLFMGFSRQEYWSGLPCPPPGDLPDPGIEPTGRWTLHHFATWEAPEEHCSALNQWRTFWHLLQYGWTLRTFVQWNKPVTEERNTVQFCSFGVTVVVLTDRKKKVVMSAGRRGDRTLLFDRDRVSALQDEKVLEMEDSDVSTVTWVYLMPQNYMFKKWLKE